MNFVDNSNTPIVGTVHFVFHESEIQIVIPIKSDGTVDHSKLGPGKYTATVINSKGKIVFGPHEVIVSQDGTLTLARKAI